MSISPLFLYIMLSTVYNTMTKHSIIYMLFKLKDKKFRFIIFYKYIFLKFVFKFFKYLI